MRVAIASTDNKTVNEHFGLAERFLIYEIGAGALQFVEERPVVPYSDNNPKHPFDAARFSSVFEAIQDCARVYVVKIGEKPVAELKARGVEAVVFAGAIADIV